MKYVGFAKQGQGEAPAWFYHVESALNFASACGFTREDGEPLTEQDLDRTDEANVTDLLDTPHHIWTVEGGQ